MRSDSTPVAAVLIALLAFAGYAALRQTYAAGSDSYGYYSLALLFEQGRMTLPVGFDPSRFPAVAPLGYVVDGARVVPTYSPALPFLMFLAMPFGLESFVTPIFGAISVLLAFALLRRHVAGRTALAFTALWAVSPLVVWGSRSMMSDLIAAVFALGILLLHGRERFLWAGLLGGLALAVRPSNALMLLPVAATLALRPAALFRLGLGVAIGALPIAAYDAVQYGSPLRTGYGSFGYLFGTSRFWHHLVFYPATTLGVLSPLVLLGLLPVVSAPRRYAFLAAWFPIFLLFFCCFWPGADYWWQARYMLPSYPALLVLMAIGAEQAGRGWAERGPRDARTAAWAPALLGVAGIACAVAYGLSHDAYTPGDGGEQARASFVLRDALPPDAVVGTVEMSGALRLYGGLETFMWYHEGAEALVDFALGEGRPVYFLFAPPHEENERVAELRERYTLEPSLLLADLWDGTQLWRVVP